MKDETQVPPAAVHGRLPARPGRPATIDSGPETEPGWAEAGPVVHDVWPAGRQAINWTEPVTCTATTLGADSCIS